MDKQECLNQAIEITKEWCRGGSQGSPDAILDYLYRKLLELNKDVESEK